MAPPTSAAQAQLPPQSTQSKPAIAAVCQGSAVAATVGQQVQAAHAGSVAQRLLR